MKSTMRRTTARTAMAAVALGALLPMGACSKAADTAKDAKNKASSMAPSSSSGSSSSDTGGSMGSTEGSTGGESSGGASSGDATSSAGGTQAAGGGTEPNSPYCTGLRELDQRMKSISSQDLKNPANAAKVLKPTLDSSKKVVENAPDGDAKEVWTKFDDAIRKAAKGDASGINALRSDKALLPKLKKVGTDAKSKCGVKLNSE